MKPKQEDTIHRWLSPLPGFVEITWSLQGDNLSWVVTGIPPELAEDQSPIEMVGSTMFSAWLFQDVTSWSMCINMVTCSMNLVGIGIVHPADDHLIPALENEDSDWVPNYLPSAITHPSWVVDCLIWLCWTVCLACLPKCFSFVLYYSYISLLVTPKGAFYLWIPDRYCPHRLRI